MWTAAYRQRGRLGAQAQLPFALRRILFVSCFVLANPPGLSAVVRPMKRLWPLLLAGSAHRLYVNEGYVGAAVNAARLTVPALGTATQALTFHFENIALAGKVRELVDAAAINYRIESQLHPADAAGAGRIKVSTTGKVDLGAFKTAAGI